MTCFTFRDRLDDYLDGQLPPWVRTALDAHLTRCSACRERVAFERTVRDHVRASLRSVEVPSWLTARISAAIAFTAKTAA